VTVGEGCEIHPYVSVFTLVEIGNHVKIFSGSVLGSEGFGFIEGANGYIEMPQLGKVVVEDNVRIGANCTIARGTLGETRIGKGSKLDDQVHIAHNCILGKNCILCGQASLAGSTVLEDEVVLGGQVGLAGHLTVGKGAKLAGQSGASINLKPGETYLGSPAIPIREAIRAFVQWRKLPELAKRIQHLQKVLESLDGKS
jgi:UDP-3-O-[3-hydroxymyristoyl] glucosamine N-acyltransferase